MSIEEDLKQTRPFENNFEKALVNLLFTHNWVNDQLKTTLSPFDITPKQYNILRILNGATEPLTTSEIRVRMIDKMSDITRLIERMLKKNLVFRKMNSEDKRLVDISITAEGKALLAEIKESGRSLTGILSGLEDSEARILSELLEKARTIQK